MCNINIANGWIWTVDLWCWKQPLYQINLNHFQLIIFDLFLDFWRTLIHKLITHWYTCQIGTYC